MDIQHNFLGMYRKKSMLNQTDLATIMALPDHTSVSRWENGQRKPNIQALLIYHLLFDIPIEELFARHKAELIPVLAMKISERIKEIKLMDGDSITPLRIAFLERAFTRLASITS